MSNHVTITGRVGDDWTLRFTPQGTPVGNCRIADTPRRFNRQTQQWEDAGDTLWLGVVAWHELAEAAAETVRKGAKVTVTGRLQQRDWQDNEGAKRSAHEIIAESIAVHPAKSGTSTAQQPASDPWATPAQGGFVDRDADGNTIPW